MAPRTARLHTPDMVAAVVLALMLAAAVWDLWDLHGWEASCNDQGGHVRITPPGQPINPAAVAAGRGTPRAGAYCATNRSTP